MARGRMIANTVATDKRLNALTPEAALVYLMAIPHLDRDGLILGDTMPFWGKVCPRRSEFMGHMADIIAEWIDAGLVISYECEDGTILCFTGFLKNQTGMHYDREAASAFPTPPGYIRGAKGLEKISNGATPDKLRTNSGLTPAESKVKESKGKEVNNSRSGSVVNPWLGVVEAYEHEIGVISEHINEDMHEYYDEMGATLVIDAIKEAAVHNKRSWAYVTGILKKWRVSGRQQKSKDDGANAWQQLNGNTPDYMKG